MTLPGLARPCGSNAQRSFWKAARSGSPNIRGMWCFLSTPTPCSPVIEPPASTHASRMREASSAARSRLMRAVVTDQRVQVAVSGMEDIRHAQSVLLGQGGDLPEHLRQLGPRDHAVLHVVGRGDAAHRREGRLAGLPEALAVGLVARHADLGRAGGRTQPVDVREARLDLRHRAVELDQ